MTPDLLAALAAILISLLAAYLPGFGPWYARLPGTHKRLFMLAALAGAAAGSLALGCAFPSTAQSSAVRLTCDRNGLLQAGEAFIAALVANQGAYLLLVRPASGELK
jgi:hypothetical protein